MYQDFSYLTMCGPDDYDLDDDNEDLLDDENDYFEQEESDEGICDSLYLFQNCYIS